MMSTNTTANKRKYGAYVILFVSICTMFWLHFIADKRVHQHHVDSNEVFVPSYRSVKLCSMGYDRFLADMYWLGFVQYAGEIDPRRGAAHGKAYQWVDLITQLDPYFGKPYWFGCWMIGYWQKRPDLAEKILKRAIVTMPTIWEWPFLAGVNAYIFGHEPHRAAEYYRQADKLGGGPSYLARHAKILDSSVPDHVKRIHTLYALIDEAKDSTAREAYRKEAVAVLTELYKTAPTAQIRDSAKVQLRGLGEDVSKLP